MDLLLNNWVGSTEILLMIWGFVHFLGLFTLYLCLILFILCKFMSAIAWLLGTISTLLLVVTEVIRFLVKSRAEPLILWRLRFIILLREISWIWLGLLSEIALALVYSRSKSIVHLGSRGSKTCLTWLTKSKVGLRTKQVSCLWSLTLLWKRLLLRKCWAKSTWCRLALAKWTSESCVSKSFLLWLSAESTSKVCHQIILLKMQTEEAMMQRIEFKVSMVAINGCFNECIKQFNEDKLTPSEQQCLTYCA